MLVEPAWVEEHLDDGDLRLVDLREGTAYVRGHLPGAVHLELAELGHTRGSLDNVLIDPIEFTTLMEALGVSNDTSVVGYDDQWGLAAARLVWALNVHGHRDVAVLDGGWDRWSEEGRPVTDEAQTPRPGRFTPRLDPKVAATYEWLAGHVGRRNVALIDTRTRGEFDQGHLPGAHWWDWFTAVPPGSWDTTRGVEELREEWAALDLDGVEDVVVYCRSGMRAAHTYVVLKHAGYRKVRLYDGSWQEWNAMGSESEHA